MAKKPGSWNEINKLTGKVKVISKNGKTRAGIFATLFIAGAAVFAAGSYYFVNEVINYNGIQTTGDLPNWNFEKGNGFEVDFGKTPMNNLKKDQKPFERIQVEEKDSDGNIINKYDKVVATSLRLQFAYNDIFQRAPKDFITKNPLYNKMFSKVDEIEIIDIYTDVKLKNKLNIDDVQRNNFDVFDCSLFLVINYEGSRVKNPILMPTIFYGNEGFLSNFIQFKLLNTLHKDDAGGTALSEQSSILGKHSSKMLMNIDGKDDNLNRKNTSNLYKDYETMFGQFFSENQGENKEFTSDIKNPFNNFVITGVNKNDSLGSGNNIYKYDSSQYLFDINQIFALATPINKHKINITKKSNLGNVKYLLPLISFLKNIYVKDGAKFAVPREFLKDNQNDLWDKLLDIYDSNNDGDTLNRYITTRLTEGSEVIDDSFYFTFIPEETSIQDMLMRLKSEFHEMINNAMDLIESGVQVDLGDLLIKSFKSIKKDLLQFGSKSKYWWFFNYNNLPFQTYWNTEAFDSSTLSKNNYAQKISPWDNGFAKIDKPELHEIIQNSKEHKYDFSDATSRNKLFTDLWGASGASNSIDLHTDTDTESETGWKDTATKEFIKKTFEFITSKEIRKLVANPPTNDEAWKAIITKDYDVKLIPLDEFNMPITDGSEPVSIDFVGTLKEPSNTPKNLQKITFRFSVNWE